MAGVCENIRKQLSCSQRESSVETQTSCDVKPVAPGLPVGSGFGVGGHVSCLCTRAASAKFHLTRLSLGLEDRVALYHF